MNRANEGEEWGKVDEGKHTHKTWGESSVESRRSKSKPRASKEMSEKSNSNPMNKWKKNEID